MIKADANPIHTSYVNGTFFSVGDRSYTLHLRYDGPIPAVGEDVQDEIYRYGIALAGVTDYLETGTLAWSPLNGPMTFREAQKTLITYWRTTNAEVQIEPTELDKIVEKCAAWMHAYFLSEHEENTDYDIVSQYMDDEQWSVVLRPNYMPKRLVEFFCEGGDVEIHSHIEDNELSVKFSK